MITAPALYQALLAEGFGPFTGLPCSYLGSLISHAQRDQPDGYIPATNEGEAVAIAAGAQLAGRRPVVILQSSGLGNAVNPLTSLCHTLRIPVLLLVTWRGEPGHPDEPQHELMGQITPRMLALMDIPYEVLTDDQAKLPDRVRAAARWLRDTGRPYAFVVRKGTLAPYPTGPAAVDHKLMSRRDAIAQVVDGAGPDAAIIATAGRTGRELEREWDRPGNLYLVGSMGCASSVALGVATYAPDRLVVVIDGDGAALMRLEALVTIGHRKPANLLHVLLDNQAHESAGGQPTLSGGVDLTVVAHACGYRWTYQTAAPSELRMMVARIGARPGPGLVRARISAGSDPKPDRPAISPPQVAARFAATVQGGSGQGSTVQGATAQDRTIQGGTIQGGNVQGGNVQGGNVRTVRGGCAQGVREAVDAVS